MDRVTAFLEIERKPAPKQSPAERLHHYREFVLRRSPTELQEQAARCMNCGTPFCHGLGCPLDNIIPEFNDLVFNGRWREAADMLHLTNNFPEITGRVCPALCEAACINAIDGQAVAIRDIELAIIEHAFEEGWVEPQPPDILTGKRVAIIGSGPAGLAAAQQLRRAGHQVVVFEKAEKPGGLLRYGIPDFKLEKWVLDRRIAQMRAEGVSFKSQVEVGKDVSATYIKRRFDALCLTIGAGQPRDLNIAGRELSGIHFALDFLQQNNRRLDGASFEGPEIHAAGKRVVVIGGGDTGSDCVGTALRQGALSVQQIELLPKPPDARSEDNPWPQWPFILRTSTSHEEGGQRDWSINTLRFIGEDSHVTGLECVRLAWEKTPAGQMKMTPIPGSEFFLPADLVLLAMGFVGPVHEGLLDSLGVAYDARGTVKVDENMMTSVPGVFAAGDVNTGAWLVVGAIATSRRMARRVDQYLMGESDLPDCVLPPRL
ncbi:MAG: glutamate synthase subunit beta [Anaerolineae bacterium]|nr:glutamate synthase subunit beta [Anaerolineae bacterium]